MNDDDFNAMVDKIQSEIFAEARAAWGEAGFARWRHPRFNTPLVDADGYARITGNCGDTMEMFLRVEDGRVAEASYRTDGCGSSAVCGSFAAELAIDRPVSELFDLTGEQVLARIGRFPKDEEHCAHLAIHTLQEAAGAWLARQRHPSGQPE
jgi:nitrogen fixation protein NifU and related proteins